MDVVFDDESFQPLIAPPTSHGADSKLQDILCNWDTCKPTQLTELVQHLLELYQKHQHQRLLAINHARLQFELSTLPMSEGVELMYREARDGEGAKVRQTGA